LPNIRSAAKRHRQSLKARERNKSVKTRIKNVTKSVHEALEQNDAEQATVALQKAASVIDRAAQKRVIHWKKAARKISSLNRALNSFHSSRA